MEGMGQAAVQGRLEVSRRPVLLAFLPIANRSLSPLQIRFPSRLRCRG